MYMKSLVSLAVLGAMSAVATAGDLVAFDKPNESYTVDGLSKYGAKINASDITITNTTYNGIDAYGVFDLNAANDISIQGATNGIFTPIEKEFATPSITIKTPKKLTITGPWAIHAEGKGKITIDAGDLVLRGSNGIAANSTGTVSIDAQTVDIACTNKYGVSSANTGGVTIKAEKSIYIKGGSANAVNGLQGAIKLESNGTTVVDGDILARAATVSADFKGAGSSLTGAVTTGDTGTTKLGFSDGALWKAEGDSKVSELTLKGGVVDLNNHNVTAKQLAENSAATIRLDAGAETLGSFTVGNQDVKADLNVDLVQNADVVDEALAKQALQAGACADPDGRQYHGRSPRQGRPGQSRHHLQQGRFDGFGRHQHAHSRHARSGCRKLAFAQPHSHERRAQAHGRSSFVQRQERRLGPL